MVLGAAMVEALETKPGTMSKLERNVVVVGRQPKLGWKGETGRGLVTRRERNRYVPISTALLSNARVPP